jgi:hypothetical protein
MRFKPHLLDHELPEEVQAFEETILAFVDEYGLKMKERQRDSRASSFINSDDLGLTPQRLTPSSSATTSVCSSRRESVEEEVEATEEMDITAAASSALVLRSPMIKIMADNGDPYDVLKSKLEVVFEDEELLEELVDRSVKILPGVRRMIDSIPEGRYCVATSGAKTYGASHALEHCCSN